MCIRDRVRTSLTELLLVGRQWWRIVASTLKLDASQLRFDSVSYTHLRAHETVLDLVCRLLLETKTDS